MTKSQYDENLHYDSEHCVVSYVCSQIASGRLLRLIWGGVVGHAFIIIEGINIHGEYVDDKMAIDFVSRECAAARNQLIVYFYIIKVLLGMQTNGVIRALPPLPNFTDPLQELKKYWLSLTPNDHIKSWVVKREDVKRNILDNLPQAFVPKYTLPYSYCQGEDCVSWLLKCLASFEQCERDIATVFAEFQKGKSFFKSSPKAVAKYLNAKLTGKAIPW